MDFKKIIEDVTKIAKDLSGKALKNVDVEKLKAQAQEKAKQATELAKQKAKEYQEKKAAGAAAQPQQPAAATPPAASEEKKDQ